MPNRTTNWPNGTPNWVDCCFTDVKAAKNFYGKLFGWDVEFNDDGSYGMCLKNGHPAAALAPNVADEFLGSWTTFFATDDVEGVTERVRQAGGTVVVEPMQIPQMGRTACYRDPEGALFGVWDGLGRIGFEIYNEPGSVVWNDLMTRDLDAAKLFYGKVFDVTFTATSDDYVTISRPGDGAVVAGMHQAANLPADVEANWLVHFAVANRDASVSMVEELDGEVLMSFDTPFGPEALVRGPGDEVFGMLSLTDEATARIEQMESQNSLR